MTIWDILFTILAFAAGFSLCLILVSISQVSNPDGYFIIDESIDAEEFIKAELNIPANEFVNKKMVNMKIIRRYASKK